MRTASFSDSEGGGADAPDRDPRKEHETRDRPPPPLRRYITLPCPKLIFMSTSANGPLKFMSVLHLDVGYGTEILSIGNLYLHTDYG